MPSDTVPAEFQIKRLAPNDGTDILLHESVVRMARRGGLPMNVIDPEAPFVKMYLDKKKKPRLSIEHKGQRYSSVVVFGITMRQALCTGANALPGEFTLRKTANGSVADPVDGVTEREAWVYQGDIARCWAPGLKDGVARFSVTLGSRDPLTGNALTQPQSRLSAFNDQLRKSLVWAQIMHGVEQGKMLNGDPPIKPELCVAADKLTEIDQLRQQTYYDAAEKTMRKLPFVGDKAPPAACNCNLHLDCTTGVEVKAGDLPTKVPQAKMLDDLRPFAATLSYALDHPLEKMDAATIMALYINREFFDVSNVMAMERTASVARLAALRTSVTEDNKFQLHRLCRVTYNGVELKPEARDWLRLQPDLLVVASFRLDTYLIPGNFISFGMSLCEVDIIGSVEPMASILPDELIDTAALETEEQKHQAIAMSYGPLVSGTPALGAPPASTEFDDLDATMLSDGEDNGAEMATDPVPSDPVVKTAEIAPAATASRKRTKEQASERPAKKTKRVMEDDIED